MGTPWAEKRMCIGVRSGVFFLASAFSASVKESSSVWIRPDMAVTYPGRSYQLGTTVCTMSPYEDLEKSSCRTRRELPEVEIENCG